MDTKARIRELMQERGWSEYRLAIASGLSQSTVTPYSTSIPVKMPTNSLTHMQS